MFRRVCIFIVKIFLNICFKINIVNVERFEKLKSGCIVTPNHISAWETLIIPSKTKRVMYIMAKEELFKNKILKSFFTSMKVFPIGRGKVDVTAVKNSVEILKNGNAVCMFPEGTRSHKVDKLKFKTGAAMIAGTAKVPIIPVGVFPEKNYRFRSKVNIVYGEPVYFYDYYDKKLSKEDLNKMTTEIEEAVYKAINSVKG